MIEMKNIKTLGIASLSLMVGFLLIFFIILSMSTNNKYLKIKNAHKASDTSYIGSSSTARVNSIEVQIGDFVKEGQVLLILDKAALESEEQILTNQLRILESELQEKKGFYKQIEKNIGFQRKKFLYEKKIQDKKLENCKRQLDIAEKKYLAVEDLYKKKYIRLVEFQSAEEKYQMLKNEYELLSLESNSLQDIEMKATKQGIFYDGGKIVVSQEEIAHQIAAIETKIEIQEEKIKFTRQKIENSVVKSPKSGKICDVMVSVGEIVQLGDKLMAISNSGEEWVEAYINEKHLRFIKEGTKVKIYFKAYPDLAIEGKVEAISQVIQQNYSTSKYELKINEESPGYDSKYNKYLRVKIAYMFTDFEIPNGISALVLVEKETIK